MLVPAQTCTHPGKGHQAHHWAELASQGSLAGAGGPGLAAGREGSVVETQRALLLRFRLLLLLTLQGELGVVQMEGDTVSDSLPLLLSALCSVSSVVSDSLQPRGL